MLCSAVALRPLPWSTSILLPLSPKSTTTRSARRSFQETRPDSLIGEQPAGRSPVTEPAHRPSPRWLSGGRGRLSRLSHSPFRSESAHQIPGSGAFLPLLCVHPPLRLASVPCRKRDRAAVPDVPEVPRRSTIDGTAWEAFFLLVPLETGGNLEGFPQCSVLP